MYSRVVVLEDTDDCLDRPGVRVGLARADVVQRVRVARVPVRLGEVNGHGDFYLHPARESMNNAQERETKYLK